MAPLRIDRNQNRPRVGCAIEQHEIRMQVRSGGSQLHVLRDLEPGEPGLGDARLAQGFHMRDASARNCAVLASDRLRPLPPL